MLRFILKSLLAGLVAVTALNRELDKADNLSLTVPEGTKSGDPIIVGGIPVVALEGRGESTVGKATCQTDGAFRVLVKAHKAAEAGEAIAEGDVVYSNGEGLINVDPALTRYGYALKAIASGEEEIIPVKIGY